MLKATRRFLHNTEGSALVLVLVMITFITLIVGAVLMANAVHLRLIRKQQHELEAQYLAEAGVHKTMWYLAGNGGRDHTWRPQQETIELFDGQHAEITLDEWGGFLRLISTAEARHQTKSVRALVGETPPPVFEQAIVLGGADYPLVVTGRNRIVGDVTTGPHGVKTGRIKGRNFEGEHVVEGRVLTQRSAQMPYFDSTLLDEALLKYGRLIDHPAGARYLRHGTIDHTDSLQVFRNNDVYYPGDVVIRVYDDSTRISGPLRLSCSGNLTVAGNTSMSGYVELLAGGAIKVLDEARLSRCNLFGRNGIEISGQAQVEGQLFSTGDIVVRERASLRYPSLIFNSGEMKDGIRHGRIAIEDQAVVRGTVILSAATFVEEGRNESIIELGANARVVGALFSENHTNHQGTIYGTLITDKFWLYDAPTIYLNWLKDSVTDRSKLPQGFLLPLQFSEHPRLEVLSWEML